MNLNQQGKLKIAVLSIIILLGTWAILPQLINYFFDADDTVGIQAVTANTKYGISGRQAPELNLTSWIDGAGNPTDPIKLKDYRGKVIFLYFFQDW